MAVVADCGGRRMPGELPYQAQRRAPRRPRSSGAVDPEEKHSGT
ncbi:hypothetical protein ACIOHS_34955 [Streptomyces sp. NPDC088253]